MTIAVVDHETKFKRKISGVCSSWLKFGVPGTTVVPVWLKKGTMRFSSEKPMILVGPGTGVAAFRAAIQEAYKRDLKQTIVLVFGCRSEQ